MKHSKVLSGKVSTVDGNVRVPNGVFTLLTDCYSPTCKIETPCYSVTCPKRFAEKVLPSAVSTASISKAVEKPAELWSTSVTQGIVESVTKKELGRQETIFEIITTEREFVKDLENTIKVYTESQQQHYVEPLRVRNIIPIEKREEFIKQVFSNIAELLAINSKLLKKLNARQKESPVVDKVGDIFANITHEVYPYVDYGAQQVYAKSILDEERQTNPEFAKFLKETEKITDFRKLPIGI